MKAVRYFSRSERELAITASGEQPSLYYNKLIYVLGSEGAGDIDGLKYNVWLSQLLHLR